MHRLRIVSFLVVIPCLAAMPVDAQRVGSAQDYGIETIRFATVPDFPVSVLVEGAAEDERINIAMVVWLIRGNGKVILFDTGFHREAWFDRFDITDYVRPDRAVELAGG